MNAEIGVKRRKNYLCKFFTLKTKYDYKMLTKQANNLIIHPM